MTAQDPPDDPRTSARGRRKMPFGAAPIKAIVNREEEIKCRILDALGLLAHDAIGKRHRRRDVIAHAHVTPSEGDIAIRELSDARALFFNTAADDVRILSLASKKRVREAREALRAWWPNRNSPKSDESERKDHQGLQSIIDDKALTILCRRLKQMASDTDDPPLHNGDEYVGWLDLPNADSPACRTCGAFVKVVIDVKKGQESAVRNRLAWNTTITCAGSDSGYILRDHFTAPLPRPKATLKRRRRPRRRVRAHRD